ncbi:MAG: VCBS repeat-containing protein [Herpetosiphonaceae bacterium]|nr:VCBS repeat-containing protein [Herpetosiphonaceae bacterium]
MVGELNGDGTPDLVIANQSGSVSVLLNNGSGIFTR